ncbi:MAG TPA: hypothetical protein PKW18_02770 [Candidatus Sumerlaeota bacterium]|nr:MAG: hypothetical protein BWY12_01918 [candidate division BRC1 bacterium ADurb.Bin183]HOE64260.1 hypothetical protein [Candidatus Sumerlaeota bacterium]HRR31379.1 hypothetical protein [Candidatus Sumerlaeia bacterium]HON50299.1 hypothetical protein [Candidatus Sumerlaeota bacterium]HOR63515.1 hypothetical protein [Candidatus Sumerlaeota bacterium]
MGTINIVSIIYLSFVVAFILGLNDHDTPRKIIRATLRRWLKLLAALVVIGAVVLLLSHI